MAISEDLINRIKSGEIKGNLGIYSQDIDDEDAIKLALALKENPYITSLSLRNQNIGDIGIKAISEISTLEELDVSNDADYYSEEHGNHITSIGAEALAKSCLKQLNITGNSIGDEGLKFLAENQTITELIAADCEITSEGSIYLFKENILIKTLDISDNSIEDEGISTINLNNIIEKLNLTNCSITGKGMEHIAKNNSLIKLDMGDNDLRDYVPNLPLPSKLRYLNLQDCKISDVWSSYFINSNLETLILLNNQITSKGARDISKNDNISYLNISFNSIDEEGLKDLINIPSLNTLRAVYNKIGEKGVNIVDEVFNNENESPLNYVNLMGNNVSTSVFINKKRKASENSVIEEDVDHKSKRPRF